MPEPHDPASWVSIQEQSFVMGLSPDAARALVMANVGIGLTPERLSDEQPEHEVEVAAFRIARVPVSCAEYTRFVGAGGYEDRKLFAELFQEAGSRAQEILATLVDASGAPGPSTWQNGRCPQGREEHPVDGISFYEAAACARYFDSRLPTEAEWECAARAPDGRHFPWGNGIPDKMIANFKPNKVGGTSKIGAFPAGTNALGLVDLAGNVHEWTATLYAPYPKGAVRYRFAGTARAHVARGGAFNGDIWDLRTTSRFGVEPQLRFSGLGMRLAR